MAQMILIGLAAGAAAALLFASVASGSLVSVLLFYLAPLPILIASVGWSHVAGMIAALVAGAALGLMFDGFFFVAFLIGVGLPAWWLGYLALMARRGAQPGDLDWYPVGRLVVWAALVGTLIVTVAILNLGTDADTFRAGLKRAFERIIRIETRTPEGAPLQLSGIDAERLIDILIVVIPPTAAVIATITNLFNLWLAGRIVRISGRLKRPWPEIAAMRLPPFAAALLAAAIATSFLPSLVGTVSGVLAATLLTAFGVLGLAVLHSITRGMNGRGFVLAGAYATVALFGWPILAMTVVGLADTAIDIRGRVARKRGPPAARS